LRAISNFLGKFLFSCCFSLVLKVLSISWKGTKQFLMGDKAIEENCAVFGILSQLLWNCPGSPFECFLSIYLNDLPCKIWNSTCRCSK
jgi:hypothetical protein